jgi:hypothetical protein
MRTRQVVAVILISAATSLAVCGLTTNSRKKKFIIINQKPVKCHRIIPVILTALTEAPNAPVDFTQAAAAAYSCQPFNITTKSTATASNNLPKKTPFSDLFGFDMDDVFNDRSRSMPQMASGSGVIISEDGYIVSTITLLMVLMILM